MFTVEIFDQTAPRTFAHYCGFSLARQTRMNCNAASRGVDNFVRPETNNELIKHIKFNSASQLRPFIFGSGCRVNFFNNGTYSPHVNCWFSQQLVFKVQLNAKAPGPDMNTGKLTAVKCRVCRTWTVRDGEHHLLNGEEVFQRFGCISNLILCGP